jgi:hypothetical protein
MSSKSHPWRWARWLLPCLTGAAWGLGLYAGEAPREIREDIEWSRMWVPGVNQTDKPRVLLIGDSITEAYSGAVEKQLKESAYVARLATSKSLGDPAFLEEVALVLRNASFRVIHFNNGLHGEGYGEEEYRRDYARLLKILKAGAPGGKLICATTTGQRRPQHLEQFSPFHQRIQTRNAIARELAGKEGIPVNDLFGLVAGHPEYYSDDGTHFKPVGVEAAGRQVAGMILAALGGQPVVELRSRLWLFNTPEPARSTLTAQVPQVGFSAPANPTGSFTVKLAVDLKVFQGEKTILEIPRVVQVRLRQHNPQDRNRQNYPAFRMPDGSVPVLEASLELHSAEHPDWRIMTIGIPLAMLKKPLGEHEIVLNFSGPDWKMYVDGEMLDNDFPFGYPQWADQNVWKLDPEQVKTAAIHLPGIQPEARPAPVPQTASGIQYWMPRGHNNWVGDVETFFHQGRYHVFYLYDRRHHGSKFGCGAHYFEHLSTRDFLVWTEHEAATPLEEQWECIGTGVPFVFHNQLCLSFGWHTTRVYPEEKTTLPAQWAYLKQNGRTGTFQRGTTPGWPAGATYSASADGIAPFKKSNIMFHPCQNPSVYTDPNGKLRMLANYGSKGTWESESVDGGWRCVNPGFPPGGDCTIFFRWGNFDYILGGFTGLWTKPAAAPDSAYEDAVRQGLDFYDGSAVPAITEIPGGRFLMAAWIPVRGWGGCLVMRELIQFPGGRIGSKWMPEIMPRMEPPRMLAAGLGEAAESPVETPTFMLEFKVEAAAAKQGRAGISFLPATGERAGCELQINLDGQRAQFGPAVLGRFAGREKSLREGGSASAIENIPGVDGPFLVRVLVKGDDKLGGSVIDAEIAGQRTLISYRPDLIVKKLAFRTEGTELKNVQISRWRMDP